MRAQRLVLSAIITACLLGVCREASAIPAFARKEGVPCSYCHYRFNRLNQAGLDYYRKGFRTKVEPASSHAPIKEDFGNYFSGEGRTDLNKRTDRNYSTNARITLFGGGEVSPYLSFLVETTVAPADFQELADLFIGYTVGQDDKFAFIRGGQLLPFLLVDNPFEIAADRDPVFPRDRRVGASAGYSYGKVWGELVAGTSASAAGVSTGNNVDVVANGQYIANDKGTSFGGYYWHGNFNNTPTLADPYDRGGVVGNFNEFSPFLIAAGFSAGKGDSGGGGTTKTNGGFVQGEYVFSDKFSALLHYVRVDPDTALAGDKKNIYTAGVFIWPAGNVTLIGQLVATNQFGATDKAFRISARFIY